VKFALSIEGITTMKRHINRLQYFFYILALSACEPAGTPAPGGGGADECGASRYQGYVGRDGAVIVASDLPVSVRILHPGDIITMEFKANRLNFLVDDSGRIDRVYCG
tara:strand:- start:4123 stop:4446 length:324 start_codon:yes stop_codon:yes gene_type:complete